MKHTGSKKKYLE